MVERTKVLWLIKGLGQGGAERLLVDALPYVNRETFDYEVAYLLPYKNHLVSEFEREGIPVFCLNSPSLYDLGLVPRLVRLLRERRVSLLHSHLPYAGIVGNVAARMARVKGVIYTEHNVLSAYHPIIALLNRAKYRLEDATIAVSDMVYQSVNSWPVLRPSAPVTIRNGVDLDDLCATAFPTPVEEIKRSLGMPEDHFVIGNVAHLRPQKGHTYLLEAVQRIAAERPDVTCVIVGGEKVKGAMERLRAYARDLGVEDRVIFTGYRQDARTLLRSFDAFVLSSLYEGLPIALLEAMSLGKPVVVTRCGGVPEVVEDGVDGFLVEPRDSEALAQRVLALMECEELRQTFSQQASDKARERFGMESMVRATEGLYREVLKGSKPNTLSPEPVTGSRVGT